MKGNLNLLETEVGGMSEDQNQLIKDYHHGPSYCQDYAQAIIHFHHFVELTIKELLRQDHPLLADDASTRPVLLRKMLHNQSLNQNELEQLKTVQFGSSLQRIRKLIRDEVIADYARIQFIAESGHWLESLNGLRNKILYRGTFVLRYTALDAFVGQYILQFVSKALKLPIYSSSEFEWRYRKLNRRADPIEKIIKEFKRSNPHTARVALLKELGRAAYENPLPRGPVRKQTGLRSMHAAEEEALRSASLLVSPPDVVEIRVCPVCGVESLLIHGGVHFEDDWDERQEELVVYRMEFYTHAVECLCCTFRIEREIECKSFDGLAIKCYWRNEELTVDD